MRLRSRSGQGWRRRLPSGTSAAMSARERLEARRRIECLFDEDRRPVVPPPEKATTPVGWLDHERRRCSLEGAATTSSFGRVDDERRRTAGRRKPILDRKRKNSSSIKTNLRVHSRVHQVMPSQTLSSSACWPEGKGRKGQEQPERLLCSGHAAARRPPEAAPAAATLRTAAWR